ncbi:DUF6461 domain-containing protein [Nocardioides sp. Root190]|uniref:DUF6461 domain-containing protein n=1 Tax=Nocardioides sp. Root190 TaxID=1736488 RepID=UPI0012F9A469|nr:DUF6461 domain-containing protein [Nocardioides sp. Root190]
MADRSTYGWVLEDAVGVACCITVVAGIDSDEALRRFGADTSRPLDPSVEADDAEAYGWSISVAAAPGGVVAVEPNGFQGSREDVLLRVAGNSVAASVFWNVNDDNSFVAVRDGAVVVDVDMYDFLDADDADVLNDLALPAALRALCIQAAEVDESPWPTGLAMAETFTGVAIPRDAVVELTALYPLPQR